MSAGEVERLMGCRPGLHDFDVTVEAVPDGAAAGKHWVGSQAAVYVSFDKEGYVTERHVLAVKPMAPRGMFARVWRWLGF